MKVPSTFQDYDDDDPDIEFRRNRDKYWKALRECRSDWFYDVSNKPHDIKDFIQFLEDTYGIKVTLHNGLITDYYTITDEGLYAFFILKYM